jgi:hypothetical protein
MAQGPKWNDVVLAEYVIVGLTPHLRLGSGPEGGGQANMKSGGRRASRDRNYSWLRQTTVVAVSGRV